MYNANLLEKMLNHVSETVPYYKNLFRNDAIKINGERSFESFPLIKKDIIANNAKNFISEKYVNLYQDNKLITKKTSGSTGVFLNVYWILNDDIITNRIAWQYRNKWYNIFPNDKYISFHTTLYYTNHFIEDPKMIIERNLNISFSKTQITKDNIHMYLEKIKHFNPIWMLTQPSVLYVILSTINYQEIDILNRLKYIELTGEYLQKGLLNYFKENLPNVTFSNMYGTTETGCVALECPNGCNHVLNNTVVEVLDDSLKSSTYKEGSVILTSLRNFAMPFVRYNIGDKGELTPSSCVCGFEGYDINITLGRESDIIELPNNEKKPCYIFLYPVEEINHEYNNAITQFYCIQEKIDSFKIHLSIKEQYKNWVKSIEVSFLKSIKKHIPANVNYTFDYDLNEFFANKNKLKFFEKCF
jgi:phenylacetate-CoA ligase